jgi:hypothetical protein
MPQSQGLANKPYPEEKEVLIPRIDIYFFFNLF